MPRLIRHRLHVALAVALGSAAASACAARCESIKEEARALRAEAEACGAGDACVVVDLYALAGANNCLGAFQCAVAFNQSVDLDAFAADAKSLAADYEGCQCTMAGCLDPSAFDAVCNAEAGRCELVQKEPGQ